MSFQQLFLCRLIDSSFSASVALCMALYKSEYYYARYQVQIGDLNGAKIDSFRSAIPIPKPNPIRNSNPTPIPIPNPNPTPNPIRNPISNPNPNETESLTLSQPTLSLTPVKEVFSRRT